MFTIPERNLQRSICPSVFAARMPIGNNIPRGPEIIEMLPFIGIDSGPKFAIVSVIYMLRIAAWAAIA